MHIAGLTPRTAYLYIEQCLLTLAISHSLKINCSPQKSRETIPLNTTYTLGLRYSSPHTNSNWVCGDVSECLSSFFSSFFVFPLSFFTCLLFVSLLFYFFLFLFISFFFISFFCLCIVTTSLSPLLIPLCRA